jgi:hypothetical protein
MKAVKTLSLFFFSLLFGACFDSPDFSNVPKIKFNRIYFGPSADPFSTDSLVLEFEFEDGDGDLGLESENDQPPFHEFEFYLSDGNNITATVFERDTNSINPPRILKVPRGANGLLVRQNDLPGLPNDPCLYEQKTVYVLPEDVRIFDDSYSIIEHKNQANVVTYYEVSGPIYRAVNLNHYNILVDFYTTSDPNTKPEDYQKYSWGCQTFHSRFPVLSDDDTPLSGKISFAIRSLNFSPMTRNYWQLRFRILDRNLNTSNEVSTQLFLLSEITRTQ